VSTGINVKKYIFDDEGMPRFPLSWTKVPRWFNELPYEFLTE